LQVPLYELILDDFTRYHGGDIIETRWRESPDRAILYFKLRLPSGDFLQLGGYEEYNFFIEATQDIYGSHEKKLQFIYLMGCKHEMVTSYRIAINNNGQGIGDMTVREYPKGKEYSNKPTTGWHIGSKS